MRRSAALWCAVLFWIGLCPLAGAQAPASPSATAGVAGSVTTAPAVTKPTAPPADATASAPASVPTPATVPTSVPAPATVPAAPGAAASTAATPIDGATYVVRLRDLEARVDELKEQIRRSHTRLSLLSETILSGGVGGSRAEIRFQNEMSAAFRLTRVLFILDGAVQYTKQDDTGALAAQKEIPIFSGSIPPGDHTLQVLLQLRGYGYGVFSYLRGYHFDVKSSHSFTVTEGKGIQLDAVAWEKGGVTTPLEQRPALRFHETIKTSVEMSAQAAAPPDKDKGADKASIQKSVSVGTGGD